MITPEENPAQITTVETDGELIEMYGRLLNFEEQPAKVLAEKEDISKWLELFLAWLDIERGVSPNTLTAYRHDLGAYLGYIEAHSLKLDEVNRGHIGYYMRTLKEQGLKDKTVSRFFYVARGFHKFCKNEKLIEVDVTEVMEIPRLEKKLPQWLNKPEIDALLKTVDKACPTHHKKKERADVRDRAVIHLLFNSGMRVSELVGIRLKDINLKEKTVRVFGKGSKERICFFGRECAKILGFYFKSRKFFKTKTDHFFTGKRGGALTREFIWQMVRKYGKLAGIEKPIHPHTLRHSMATAVLNKGTDIRFVQELLGHADISTTQIYTHVSLDRLREIHKIFHPRSGKKVTLQLQEPKEESYPLPDDVPELLRLFQLHGMTLAKVAKQADLAQGNLSNYFYRVQKPTLPLLFKLTELARTLSIRSDDFGFENPQDCARLLNFIRSRGLSLNRLSKLAHISNGNLGLYAKGLKLPSLSALGRIREVAKELDSHPDKFELKTKKPESAPLEAPIA